MPCKKAPHATARGGAVVEAMEVGTFSDRLETPVLLSLGMNDQLWGRQTCALVR